MEQNEASCIGWVAPTEPLCRVHHGCLGARCGASPSASNEATPQKTRSHSVHHEENVMSFEIRCLLCAGHRQVAGTWWFLGEVTKPQGGPVGGPGCSSLLLLDAQLLLRLQHSTDIFLAVKCNVRYQ